VIVLLLWFYVSSLAILVGAELNARSNTPHRTGKRRVRRALKANSCSDAAPNAPSVTGTQSRRRAQARTANDSRPETEPRAWRAVRRRDCSESLAASHHEAARSASFGAGDRVERPMTQPAQSPALRELFGAVSEDLRALVSQTTELARLEVATATSALVTSVVGVALSLVIVLGGVGVLMSALVLIAIALGLPAWRRRRQSASSWR
jgi:hypothetical protein